MTSRHHRSVLAPVPAARGRDRPRRWAALLPGLAVAAGAAALSLVVDAVLPLVSSLLVAIVLGVLLRNLRLVPAGAEAGLAVAGRTVLRAGVVLLGLRLSVPQVLELGWGVLAVMVVTVAVTYLAAQLLGRALGLARPTRTLVATGTAICGAAAVAAMSAVLGRGQEGGREDVQEAAATAVATVTLFGTVALVAVPGLAAALGLGPQVAAVWVGASVHEVGQVVAGAGLVGAGAMDVAVLTKLGRVVLLAPVVTLVGLSESRRARRAAEERRRDIAGTGHRVPPTTPRPAPLVPGFVLGFLALVAVRSLLPLPDGVVAASQLVATALLTTAMVAMGAAVNLPVLARSGGRALVLGALAAVVAAGVSLAGLALVG